MMQIATSRFGTLQIAPEEIFVFPLGLIGMESLRQWALVPDFDNPTIAWLQSVTRGDCSIPVLSPRNFVKNYRVRASKRDLDSLRLGEDCEMYVFSTVSNHQSQLTTNLRAPILVNLTKKIGLQIVTIDEQPIRQSVCSVTLRNVQTSSRKVA
jgi:flagellar assembly factor FliW